MYRDISAQVHYIRDQLIAARYEAKLSQQELSRISGVAQAVISRAETGRVMPNMKTLLVLFKALGKTIKVEDL